MTTIEISNTHPHASLAGLEDGGTAIFTGEYLIDRTLQVPDGVHNVVLESRGAVIRYRDGAGPGACLQIKNAYNLRITDGFKYEGNYKNRAGIVEDRMNSNLVILGGGYIRVGHFESIYPACDGLYIGAVSPQTITQAPKDITVGSFRCKYPYRNGWSITAGIVINLQAWTTEGAKGVPPAGGGVIEAARITSEPGILSNINTGIGNAINCDGWGVRVVNKAYPTGIRVPGLRTNNCRSGVLYISGSAGVYENIYTDDPLYLEDGDGAGETALGRAVVNPAAMIDVYDNNSVYNNCLWNHGCALSQNAAKPWYLTKVGFSPGVVVPEDRGA